MPERPEFVSIEQLENRSLRVSSIITSREKRIAGLPPKPENPLELLSWRRREHVANLLQRSIDQRLNPEIDRIETQIAEHSIPAAKEYQQQLFNSQRDLRRVESNIAGGRMTLPAEELEKLRGAVRELAEKPLRDSLLAKTLVY